MQIAFLTLSDRGDFFIDDELAIPILGSKGIQVDTVAWDENADWSKYQAVIVRSTWDYHKRFDEFFDTLTQISQQTHLFNPLEVLEWNANKNYLFELAEKVPVIPTRKAEAFESVDQVMHEFGVDKVIFKPFVGANSENTHPLHRTDLTDTEKIDANLFSNRFFVQPFLEEIQSVGEYSLFYFNGKFSHMVLKTPKSGDYRVQEDHGGLVRKAEVCDQTRRELIDSGDRIIALLQPLLYARVDMVFAHSKYLLMELELIEPSLYLRCEENAPANFASAVAEAIAT